MELELDRILAQAFFVGARVGGLMTFAPFFGSLVVSVRVKVILTVALTAMFYPIYAPKTVSFDVLDWLVVVSGEMAVGLLIGLAMHFVFDGVRLAGQILGFQLGFSLANLVDPQSQVDTPVISIFYSIITMLIFLQLNVHHWMLRGLAKSFEYVPVGTASPTPEAVTELIRVAGGLWLVAIQLAIPVLIATMVVDIVLAFLAKASPQLPVLFMGHSIKAMVGFAVMMGAVATWPGMLERYFLEALAATERLLHLVR